MVHKPKHKVHSFRGLLADGGEDEINLERQNANIAYRIVKLQLMAATPGSTVESVVKVFRENPASSTGTVDFTDPNLLASGFLTQSSSAGASYLNIIFDNVLFSRDIYVTHLDNGPSNMAVNYHLEIEEVPVSASALMQLKLGVARKQG